MTFQEWLWSTEFWILIGPMSLLFWGMCIYEDVIEPIKKNKRPRKLDATFAIAGVPMIFVFMWIISS